jgi:hypothetical protein
VFRKRPAQTALRGILDGNGIEYTSQHIERVFAGIGPY